MMADEKYENERSSWKKEDSLTGEMHEVLVLSRRKRSFEYIPFNTGGSVELA